jgi:hypothetical protein
MARQLQTQGRLDLPDLDSQYLDWPELKPKLTGFSTEELLERLAPLLNDIVLLVDDFDGVTPPLARPLEPLFGRCVMPGAITTVDMNPELQPFFWHFQWLVLQPLTREAARELLWTQAEPASIADQVVFEQHVLDVACGNPLAIRELARQAQRVLLRTPEQIRQLHYEAGIHYVDLTPVLLLIGAGAVVLRFLALGLNDIEAYILAGSFGACFLAARYFIYRAMRGRR